MKIVFNSILDIYLVKITSLAEREFLNLYPLIDSEKSERIKRFIKSEDKLRTIVGEVLISIVSTI
ncbi:hypothetical protein [Mammaliicoccus sp. F-M27]|uniref:hypothetical protein n=1 Tax=Mammaliicoccus sp. F-M27 TaxID=2898687 RepID=UPI001EFB94A5|nr:hypothetical protein [Mammaliicoccus sp. F-M27]